MNYHRAVLRRLAEIGQGCWFDPGKTWTLHCSVLFAYNLMNEGMRKGWTLKRHENGAYNLVNKKGLIEETFRIDHTYDGETFAFIEKKD